VKSFSTAARQYPEPENKRDSQNVRGTRDIFIPAGNSPLHERLAQALELAISTGRVLPGERLPTHRRIASEFGIAVGTVTRAIELLARQGIVGGEPHFRRWFGNQRERGKVAKIY
jgi:DNA-binding transcriptional MocR family regulator